MSAALTPRPTVRRNESVDLDRSARRRRPFGAHDRRVVSAVRRAGYLLAVTTIGGTRQSAAAPLELRRLSIVDSTGVAGLAAMLGG
jgi:hypothetical protein